MSFYVDYSESLEQPEEKAGGESEVLEEGEHESNLTEVENAESGKENRDADDAQPSVPGSGTGDDNDEEKEFFDKLTKLDEKAKNDDEIIEKLKTSCDQIDGQVLDAMWPTLGGWNVEELYSEVLFALLHSRGSGFRDDTTGVVSHLQQVFRIDNDKHYNLLNAVSEKDSSAMVLNIEVVEAKELKGKDMNGLSDPFCTLYTNQNNKQNTSMKPENLNPVWREYFSFTLRDPSDQNLFVEVWDFDPEESLSDKMKKLTAIKSARGMKVLLKEMAITASAGKNQHEFLGLVQVPIDKIPTTGLDQWFHLEKKSGGSTFRKKKGQVHLRVAIGAQKEVKVAAQEYRHVLHLMLIHELDEENIEPHKWDGQFTNKYSNLILKSLQLQGNLTNYHTELARWIVFTRVQVEHPLNTSLFPPMLKSIISYFNSGVMTETDKKKFWFTTEKLMDNFIHHLKGIHQCFLSASDQQLSNIFSILETIGILKEFLKANRNKISEDTKLTIESIAEKVSDTVSTGAHELFLGISSYDVTSGDSMAEHMIQLGQILVADLRKGLKTVQQSFHNALEVSYFDLNYVVYDELYHEMVKSVVEEECTRLKPFKSKDVKLQSKDITAGTTLFELYLTIKQFADLSTEMTEKRELYVQPQFHTWFYQSVVNWLDIAWYKAMNRIEKAVALDTLKTVDDYAKFSSSAIDSAHVFHQILIFWNQLSWPEVDGSYSFIAKILDDLCRCAVYYVDLMCKKALDTTQLPGGRFEISDELCTCLNDVEWVEKEVSSVADKLEVDKLIEKMSEKNGKVVAGQCRSTLDTVAENMKENINNKFIELAESIGNNMQPTLFEIIATASEEINERAAIKRMIAQLDSYMIKINRKLSENGFQHLFAAIWTTISNVLGRIANMGIQNSRNPQYFERLDKLCHVLWQFFYPEEASNNNVDVPGSADFQKTHKLIKLHASSTPELIMLYNESRYEEQKSLDSKNNSRGSVSVRAQYLEDMRTLKVEVLNARGLRAQDSNGQCDPYIKIKLCPEAWFPASSLKTKVKKKTLFPLFDETFSMLLTREHMSLNGVLFFSVKDHDLFGKNDFLGECFLPLNDIPFTTQNTKMTDLKQIHLPLSLPNNGKSMILQVLRIRGNIDRVAADFLKKELEKVEVANEPSQN